MRPRIDVLAYVPSLGFGGAQKHLVWLLNHLDRKVFRLSVAVGRGGGSYRPWLREDVAVHVLREGPFRSSVGRGLRCIRPLRRLIGELRPDVIHTLLPFDHAVVAAATVGLQEGPLKVFGIHSSVDHIRIVYGSAVTALLTRVWRHADGITAVSEGVAEEVRSQVPEVSRRIRVLYNATVSEQVLERARIPLKTAPHRRDGPLLVACGRLAKEKGYNHLVDAVGWVAERRPLQLWILGEGAEREALQQQIDYAGLQGTVELLGFVDNPYQYMAAADLFVLSSLNEGLPLVLIEAMACGTPVISTDCPHGPSEIVENGVSGLLVPPADAEGLANGILELLNDPERTARLAAAGERRARDFSAEAAADAYGAYFRNLVDTRTRISA